MPKPLITSRQEEMLSYFVGLAPMGQEFTIDMKIIRDDLGYTTVRGVYAAARRLRDLGALILHGRARSWDRTTWSCHKRPEEFQIIPSRVRNGNPGPRKKAPVTFPEVSVDVATMDGTVTAKRNGLVRYQGYDGTTIGW